MSELEVIEDRIRANPDDTEAWKIYADWLLDHGDRRGELIMLELQPGAREDPSLLEAIESLRPGPAWEPAGLPVRFPARIDYRWRHGFVDGVTLSRIDHWTEVHALQGLFTDPQARFLSALTLRFRRARKHLFKVPGYLDFSRLREFCVSHVVRADKFVHELVQQPALALTGLEISDSDLTDKGLSELVGCPQLRGLRRLSLSHNAFGSEGIHALASAPVLSGLEELDLQSNEIEHSSVSALVASPFLKRMTGLWIDVDEEAAQALEPSFSQVRRSYWKARS